MSKNPLLIKFLFIGAVVALMFFFAYPPKEKINLGLDLKGGAYILMQVEADSAVNYEATLRQSFLGQQFKDDGLTYDSIVVVKDSDRLIEVKGTDSGKTAEVREVFSNIVGNWTVDSKGGGDWLLTMPLEYANAIKTQAVDIALETIRSKVDTIGVAEPTVQKQGLNGDRILVQLPGLDDSGSVIDKLQNQRVLEWKAVSYPPGDDFSFQPGLSREATIAMFPGGLPDDTELYPQSIGTGSAASETQAWWPLKLVSAVVGSDLRQAYRSTGQFGEPEVAFTLTNEAGRRFHAATTEYLKRRMAIVLVSGEDREVISVPVIEGVIRDQGVIRGGFTLDEADALAMNLNSGAIPTSIRILETNTVGPSLGKDSIERGIRAGLAGFIGIMIFMVLYYRFSGVNAVVALALNMLLVFGTLGALPFLFDGARATLTLPGIAGLILTIGMAVDSNVLIFERIREELRIGKTVRAAVEQGFGKAFSTILDCNVTTLVAALFLFTYGTGPVKGFAVTLTIGLLSSMFTAIFVSRQIFELVLSRKKRDATLSI
ncbi:MAG: protein translocase subunit SecD [Acidobacteriota bacterium]|nr:protein translocase subunit SecD [Acidobacteriota bacterium]MDH3785060.1 protein translocase subunit SecD [Acidobacteriota bacterium]